MLTVLLAVASRASSPSPIRVLFIGNSLTYANDLPRLVAAMGDACGGPRRAGPLMPPEPRFVGSLPADRQKP